MTAAARLILVSLLIGTVGGHAVAETAAARAACTPSVFRLCPMAALAGDRAGAKACLLKNIDRASAQCQAAVRAEPEVARERVVAPTLPSRGRS